MVIFTLVYFIFAQNHVCQVVKDRSVGWFVRSCLQNMYLKSL